MILQSFDYLDEILESRHRHEQEAAVAYYASELLEALGYQPGAGEEALQRAMRACAALHVPLELNFRKTYCAREGTMEPDWQLSPLASYLLIVNCDPGYPPVAEAQLLFLKKNRSF
ncbi:hypothetical protein EGT74_21850 [Chitinophaga lutea]|uniref:Uncharacterized protein n=1 Tax=Chitinophaga lutea TaxID=2488634 RepID=A0A3N4QCZ5_9BACT|nr:hypothetical protein [Chitinophaga lutea]RPE09624.1 hypothetical protein EGT74_21850 [Chitinophaga lutea]